MAWLSNNLVFAITLGLFAGLLVMFTCELQKFQYGRHRAGKCIFNQFDFYLRLLSIIPFFIVCQEQCMAQHILIPIDNTIESERNREIRTLYSNDNGIKVPIGKFNMWELGEYESWYDSIFSIRYAEESYYTPENLQLFLNRIYHLFDFHKKYGNTRKAHLYADELFYYVLGIPDSVFQSKKNGLGLVLRDLSSFKSYDESNALFIESLAYKALKNEYGIKDTITLRSLLDLSTCYFMMGHKNQAIKHAEEVACLAKDNKRMRYIYLDALDKLSEYYLNIDNNRAEELSSLSFKLKRKQYGKSDRHTIESSFSQGYIMAMVHNSPKGIKRMKDALVLLDKNFSLKKKEYGDLSYKLAKAYLKMKDYYSAINVSDSAIVRLTTSSISGKRYKKVDLRNIQLRILIAEGLYCIDDTANFITVSKSLSQLFRMYLPRISKWTVRERELFSNSETISRWYDVILPLATTRYYNSCNGELLEILLNSSLQRKNFLLVSDRDIRNQIKQRDSIQWYAKRRYAKLIRSNSQVYSYSNPLYSINWKQIVQALPITDIAIDFIDFPDSLESSEKRYAAIIISPGKVNPIFVPLFSESEYKRLKSNHKSSADSLISFQIWNALSRYTRNASNVYFSPSGVLNSIAIENYVSMDGINSMKCDLYRLSSLKELIRYKVKLKMKTAILYGGLDYDTILDMNSQLAIDTTYLASRTRGLSDSLMYRGAFENLANTLSEVKDISQLLSRGGFISKVYEKDLGTEDTFKLLSGQQLGILHLSTHGMYIDYSEAKRKKEENNFRFIKTISDDSFEIPEEDDVLSRSFLVMSGGNSLIRRENIPSWMDDGILTAQEIAELDFSGVDLVVLSACQTGLGDINSEGVFGLQRGFKKAGVNTILMSLDKVDDEATRILMVEFYRNLMNGKTKLQSLLDAQQYLRKVDNGKYDDSKYWASFIMLDGLN
ncbi:MAG: CHAT domain-containing protein [Prevotella sp.]|nr:CHAT domain-containing protein [Prevotella sp.]